MEKDKGFTLIELLVAIAIIGVLAAIAIPQFAEYKIRAFNSRAQSDLRNGLTAQEAYYADNELYVDCADSNCERNLPGFILSANVEIAYLAYVSDSEFAGVACHISGDQDYYWKSTGLNANIVINARNSNCTNPTVPTVP